MATSKDESPDARPSSQHRLSTGHTSSRPHSLSLGASNANHRVSRRKSSSSMAGVNMAAIAAAAKDGQADNLLHTPKIKQEFGDAVPRSSIPELAAANMGRPKSATIKGAGALVDGPSLSSMPNDKSKARIRRASEGGSRLARGERRRSAAGELKCDKCGKGYKHGSCLTKHLWEHTPEWSLTSKLLISKHQQVQLLEAASVLVNMNQNSNTAANESAIQESESSGDSPAASGLSDHQDEESSRSSTPEHDGDTTEAKIVPPRVNRPSRQDSYNSAFSRSYASTSGYSFAASSAPTDPGDLYWYRSSAMRRRPSTSSQSHYSSDEQADVAAAAEGLVSCSLGTPKHHSTHLSDDIPPVPPLPAQFAGQASRPVSFNRGYPADTAMSDVRGREDDDEGIFGHMER